MSRSPGEWAGTRAPTSPGNWPILQLAGIAAKVSANEDYTLRGLPGDGDEVGTLVSSFNQMLERIQERDAALQGAKEKLELRVQARTEAEGGCGRSQPGEERIPRQHEPRNPHSAERRHGDDRFGARDAAYSGATRIPGDREDVGRCPAYGDQRHSGLFQDRGGKRRPGIHRFQPP